MRSTVNNPWPKRCRVFRKNVIANKAWLLAMNSSFVLVAETKYSAISGPPTPNRPANRPEKPPQTTPVR